MTKLSDAAIAFCVCISGFTVAILYHTSLLTNIIVSVSALIYLLICAAITKKVKPYAVNDKSAVNIAIGGYCLVSCSVSVWLAASLVTQSKTMPENFYPLIALLTAVLALAFAVSKTQAVTHVTVVVSIISALILVVLLTLCVVNTSFEVPSLGSLDRGVLVLLLAFSVSDILLIFPLSSENGKMTLWGGFAAHAYGLVMTLLSVSILGEKIFNSSNMPWLTLWRSTYITSFLNSFNIIGICFFFLITAIKAGIALKIAFDVFGLKFWWMTVLTLALLVILLSIFAGIVYVAAVIAIALCVFVPITRLFKTKKSGSN